MVAPNDGPYGEDKIQHDTTIHRLGTGSFFSAFFTERTSSTNILPPLFFSFHHLSCPRKWCFSIRVSHLRAGPMPFQARKGAGDGSEEAWLLCLSTEGENDLTVFTPRERLPLGL
ncbi:hypothetical protein PDE_07231 [Penicillium oxalicum 114-2]|uniref:Uncharacterized protein n=1 Tax=Penicillium oxalicum (strain 114-2 / CGMCC 5302) TaxID=933388 RepID=S7ZU35_PENO1|nr:hypothetical protein PDE_07231 [Penicillium oxalicum 114-2]